MEKVNETEFPRIMLKCSRCNNEFQANVLRLKAGEEISCHVCGNKFPKEAGNKLSQALQSVYEVKYDLDKAGAGSFKFAFLYKSTAHQPPVPYSFSEE
ncbi:MAG: hypothetical protein PHX18_05650 [Candidatus Gastranaerophilales bacterium]|nr:hypothetical protein [Candidatus Gastranaerophilales bacterium]